MTERQFKRFRGFWAALAALLFFYLVIIGWIGFVE